MKKFLMIALMMLGGGLLSTVSVPSAVYAASPDSSCDVRVFAIPAWYNGLMVGNGSGGDCEFEAVKGSDGKVDTLSTAGKIGSNVIQAFLVIAAYVAVFFLIKGGFMYIYSAGSPEGIANAKKAIQNALIGLVIAVLAASIVNAIGAAI